MFLRSLQVAAATVALFVTHVTAALPLDTAFWCGSATTCGVPGTAVAGANRSTTRRDRHARSFLQADGSAYVVSMSQGTAGDDRIALSRLNRDGTRDIAYGNPLFEAASGIDDAIVVPGSDDVLVLYSTTLSEKRLIRIDLPTQLPVPAFNAAAAVLASSTQLGGGRLSSVSGGRIVVGFGREVLLSSTRFELCFTRFAESGALEATICRQPPTVDQADLIPEVVGVMNVFGPPIFVARTTNGGAAPPAFAFGLDVAGTDILFQEPLFLSTQCDGVPRLTGLYGVSVSPSGAGEFVLVGTQAVGTAPNVTQNEFASIYRRLPTGTGIEFVGAGCTAPTGTDAMVAVAPVFADVGATSSTVALGVTLRQSDQTLRLRRIVKSAAGNVSFEDASAPVSFPERFGGVATIRGAVSLSYASGRALLAATRAWTDTDEDAALARFVTVERVFGNGFE